MKKPAVEIVEALPLPVSKDDMVIASLTEHHASLCEAAHLPAWASIPRGALAEVWSRSMTEWERRGPGRKRLHAIRYQHCVIRAKAWLLLLRSGKGPLLHTDLLPDGHPQQGARRMKLSEVQQTVERAPLPRWDVVPENVYGFEIFDTTPKMRA
jgi:hypothetical protein